MKRYIFLLFLPALLLAGCGGRNAPAGAVSADEAARAVRDSQSDLAGLSPLSEEELTLCLTGVYGLTAGGWTDAAVYAAGGMDAREIAVIAPAEGGEEETAAALERYRQSRLGDFFGYAPDQAALVEDAQVVTRGGFVSLLICASPDAARQALESVLRGETPPPAAASPGLAGPSDPAASAPAEIPSAPAAPDPTAAPEEPAVTDPPAAASTAPESTSAPTAAGETAPPSASPPQTIAPEDVPSPAPSAAQVMEPGLDISGFPPFEAPNEFDMTLYDTAPILAAWRSGDESGLSRKDAAILARCREIFSQVITDGMTDLEKERALHDYLTDWGSYDQTAHSLTSPLGREDNTNPYGMLVGGYGICLGYASSFQLLMDLAGVECITVIGAAYRSTEDHAWNMVRLDGEWYCVDVTWDAPIGGRPNHAYFNVSSDYMRRTDHQWDYRNVPETN